MPPTRGLDVGSAEALLVVASEPKKGYDTAGALHTLLPAAVLLDLADHGLVTMGEGRVARVAGGSPEAARGYERAALALGERLDGRLPDALWAITDGLRPLPHAVAADLVAEGRVASTKNTLLKMDFGYRFPALDTDFRDAVRARVQEALETGDLSTAFGRTALLLAAGHVAARLFPGVDTAPMDAVASGETPVSGAGFTDAATHVVVNQLLTTVVQQIVLR
ncbi:GPP34 family phosphoprotein [Georgenia sp. TF02-10]|uniref:GPP34 family phosphoprotein n=1 Tax=Georgenia sp. TF02-10 TaxID=2917725 RepID=UPI001FA72E8F|nr:GPP34 family phosphoprotein [Georgenia sp. TF02-10]UNX54583.1 GPP34 family phosphoprotein [Georgenia sp. TF02-10]